jgi:lipopolysaccharide transport system permease protein
VALPTYIDRTTERTTLLGTWRAVFTYRALLRNLVSRDLKLKYRGSALGFLWSLINPLMMLVVYTVAFTVFLDRGGPLFVFLLLVGLLGWTFFATSMAAATGSLVDNASLTKSLHFPRAILPLASVFFNLAQFLLTAVVFVPILLLYYDVAPSTALLAFPIMLGLQAVCVAGLALTLSALTAMFRDARHLVEVGLGMLFWLTPIVYTLNDIPPMAARLVALTPVTPFIRGYQAMIIHQTMPSVDIWLTAVVYAVVATAVGARAFGRVEPRLGELL